MFIGENNVCARQIERDQVLLGRGDYGHRSHALTLYVTCIRLSSLEASNALL